MAIVLSAYPTKRSRLGNAVGLDTPASAIDLLASLADAGYAVDDVPTDGDELMMRLADGMTYESESLTPAQLGAAVGRLDGEPPTPRGSRVCPTMPAPRSRASGGRRRAGSASTAATWCSAASTWAT